LRILGDQTLDVLSLRFKLTISQGMEDGFGVCLVKPSLADLVVSFVQDEVIFKPGGGFHLDNPIAVAPAYLSGIRRRASFIVQG
jgi:hypothetical protein